MTKENALYVVYLVDRIERFQDFMDDIATVVNNYEGDIVEIKAPLLELINAEYKRREQELKDF